MIFTPKKITIFIFLILIIGMGLHLNKALAASELKVPFPGAKTGAQPVSEVTGPADYIKTLYSFSLGIGALLAILMIVIGGIRYTVSEAVPGKEDAKSQISSAIWGLVLLLAAYLILSTISPQLKIDALTDPGISPLPLPKIEIESGKTYNFFNKVFYDKNTQELKWQYQKYEGIDSKVFTINMKIINPDAKDPAQWSGVWAVNASPNSNSKRLQMLQRVLDQGKDVKIFIANRISKNGKNAFSRSTDILLKGKRNAK